jgi:hypothetical protein
VALSLAVYSIVQHHEVTRPSVTFAMLLIYGFMLPWALILSFLLIVLPSLASYANSSRRQSA